MSLENLLQLNKLANGVITNIWNDQPGFKITEDVMFPVAAAILDSLIREHLPPQFTGDDGKELICTIGIDDKVLQKARAVLRENENGATDSSVGNLTQKFRPYIRLDEQFVNAVMHSTFQYLFNKSLHEMSPTGVCYNRDYTHFTVTLVVTANGLTEALNKFILQNDIAIAKTSEHELNDRLIIGVENTNAYIKSMNDKLNEMSAVLNDARREIVDGLDSVKRMGAKLLDLITLVAKTSKPKAGKKEK